MAISLVNIFNIFLFLLLIIAAVVSLVVWTRNKRVRNVEKPKRGHYKLLWLLVPLAFILIFVGSAFKSSKWEMVLMTEEDKAYVATSELLLPELSKSIDRQYKRSMRDTVYLYDTNWFDNVDELLAALDYSNDNLRTSAKQALMAGKVDTQAFNTLEGGNMEVYRIVERDLPLKMTAPRDAGWQYTYYVIIDPDYGGLAKLICEKKGY